MKKLVIILMVCLSIGCKKEKLSNCVIGNWKYIGNEQNGSFTSLSIINFYNFKDDGTFTHDISTGSTNYHTDGTYTIDGSKLMLSTDSQRADVKCGSGKLKFHYPPADPNDPDPGIWSVYQKD